MFVFLRIPLTFKTYFYWTLNEHFLRFCFLDELIRLHVFTACLYFYHYWWWERKNFSILQVFLKGFTWSWGECFGNSYTILILDNLNTQKIELHTNSEDISETKLPLLPSVQNSHLVTRTLLVLTFLALFRFWVM